MLRLLNERVSESGFSGRDRERARAPVCKLMSISCGPISENASGARRASHAFSFQLSFKNYLRVDRHLPFCSSSRRKVRGREACTLIRFASKGEGEKGNVSLLYTHTHTNMRSQVRQYSLFYLGWWSWHFESKTFTVR